MAQEFQNLGPIYLTAAKYEAARTAGTLEAGREYRIVDAIIDGDVIPIDDSTIKLNDDGDLYAVIEEQTQANWSQTDNTAVDFIKNKPFDVSTTVQVPLFTDVETTYWVDSGAFQNDEFETAVLSSSDIGKIVQISAPNVSTMSATVQSNTVGETTMYYAQYNYDIEEWLPASYPAFFLISYPSNNTSEIYVAVEGEHSQGDTSTASATISSATLTKLSAEKINIDGTTIINDNGVLKANGSSQVQTNWSQTDSTSADFIKNKPFDVTTSGNVNLVDTDIDYDEDEGYFYENLMEQCFTSSDEGSSFTGSLGNASISGTIQHLTIGEFDGYGITANYPKSTSDISYLIATATMGSSYVTICSIDDGGTHSAGDTLAVLVTANRTTTTTLSATKLNLGFGLEASGDSLTLSAATDETIGGVIVDGETITINGGYISAVNPVTIDSAISKTSTNPVQNKTIEAYLRPVLGDPEDTSKPTVNFVTSTGENPPVYDFASEGYTDVFIFPCILNLGNAYLEVGIKLNDGSQLNFDGCEFSFSAHFSSSSYTSNLPAPVLGIRATDGNTHAINISGLTKLYKADGTLMTNGGVIDTFTFNTNVGSSWTTVAQFTRVVPQSTDSSCVLTSDKKISYISSLSSSLISEIGYEYIDWAQTQIWDANFTFNGEVIKTPFKQVQDKVTSLESEKQDKLTAGTNITIENNVISATGGKEDFVTTFTLTLEDEGFGITSDKTFSQIKEAQTANKNLIFKVLYNETGDTYYFTNYYLEDSMIQIIGEIYPSALCHFIIMGGTDTDWYVNYNLAAEALGPGTAININSDNEINVKYDNSTIKVNSDGELYAAGSNSFKVTFTPDETGTTAIADKTAKEIYDAYTTDKLFVYTDMGGGVWPLVNITFDETYAIAFGYSVNGDLSNQNYYISRGGMSESDVTYDVFSYNEGVFPECPTTTEGTYSLKGTVTDGGVEYSWASGSSSAVESVNGKTGIVVLKTSDIENDSSYATQSWVEGKGYLTEHQSLADYYTKSQTDSAISSYHDSSKADATHNHTVSQITDFPTLATVATSGKYSDLSGTPTIPSLDGYATETWVEGKGYLTTHQDISGKADVSALTAHTNDSTIHTSTTEKDTWNAKSTVTSSSINGYINIDGTSTKVYELPAATSTVLGGVKARLDGTTLYLSNS